MGVAVAGSCFSYATHAKRAVSIYGCNNIGGYGYYGSIYVRYDSSSHLEDIKVA